VYTVPFHRLHRKEFSGIKFGHFLARVYSNSHGSKQSETSLLLATNAGGDHLKRLLRRDAISQAGTLTHLLALDCQ
jgi:hypothetical protein